MVKGSAVGEYNKLLIYKVILKLLHKQRLGVNKCYTIAELSKQMPKIGT